MRGVNDEAGRITVMHTMTHHRRASGGDSLPEVPERTTSADRLVDASQPEVPPTGAECVFHVKPRANTRPCALAAAAQCAQRARSAALGLAWIRCTNARLIDLASTRASSPGTLDSPVPPAPLHRRSCQATRKYREAVDS